MIPSIYSVFILKGLFPPARRAAALLAIYQSLMKLMKKSLDQG
jgi:hypothetical protein